MTISKRVKMSSILSLILGFMLAGVVLSSPIAVDAQEVCGCWCSTSAGSVKQGTGSTGESAEAACGAHCAAVDGTVLACVKGGEKPPSFGLCWTRRECESSQVVLPDGTTGYSSWATKRTTQCPSAQFSDSGEEERYCYNPPIPVNLNVAINTLSGDPQVTYGLGEYIDAMYRLLIPAAAIIAVVLLMISGLQYMMAGGRQEAIAKAKDRMQKTVIGLVLILLAYSIAYLIDPGLTSFDALRVPRVRPVLFIDPNSSCETLSQYFRIDPEGSASDQQCGDKGELIEKIVEEDIPGFEEGDTCNYTACDEGRAYRCVSGGGSSNDLFCARCADSYNDAGGGSNPDAPPPTPQTCAQYETPPPGQPVGSREQFLCEYENFGGDECIEIVYPANTSATSFDCQALENDAAQQGTVSCRAYDLIGLLRTAAIYGDYRVDSIDDFYSSEGAFEIPGPGLLQDICTSDPCGFAPPGESCIVSSSLTRIDCLAPGDVTSVSGGFLDTLTGYFNQATGAELDLTENTCTDRDGNKVDCQEDW